MGLLSVSPKSPPLTSEHTFQPMTGSSPVLCVLSHHTFPQSISAQAANPSLVAPPFLPVYTHLILKETYRPLLWVPRLDQISLWRHGGIFFPNPPLCPNQGEGEEILLPTSYFLKSIALVPGWSLHSTLCAQYPHHRLPVLRTFWGMAAANLRKMLGACCL